MLRRIPLYAYLRFFFLLYLVLPQTQGARVIYTVYVHPYLEENESQIENLIATTHDNLKAAGVAYLRRAVELFRTQVLGLAPNPDARRAESNVPASQRPRGYTQSLLERFQLPQARWPGNGGATGQDFYSFLSNAVNAAAAAVSDAAARTDGAAGTASSSSASASASASDGLSGPAVGAFPSGDLSASGTLVPPSIHGDAEKMTFLAAQRERLNLVLGALDREAAQLRSGTSAPAGTGDVSDPNPHGLQPQADRPATSHSGRSTGGLSKSRSEVDFEKIDAESGAEDNSAQGADSAKATPSAAPPGSGGGSWLPWGWSASSSSDAGKNKSE